MLRAKLESSSAAATRFALLALLVGIGGMCLAHKSRCEVNSFQLLRIRVRDVQSAGISKLRKYTGRAKRSMREGAKTRGWSSAQAEGRTIERSANDR